MNEILAVLVVILSITTFFGINLAYKYYKMNKINYSNSKMSLLALGEFDRAFAVYMETQYKRANVHFETVVFEAVLTFLKKCKKEIVGKGESLSDERN